MRRGGGGVDAGADATDPDRLLRLERPALAAAPGRAHRSPSSAAAAADAAGRCIGISPDSGSTHGVMAGARRVIERLPHVGELALLITSATPQEVYAEALRGLGEEISVAPVNRAWPAERHPVALDASGGDTLLADLINEALYLAETLGLVPIGLEIDELAGGRLRGAILAVRPPAAPRHLVKAATYHQLAMWGDDAGWHGRVVLDV